MDECETEKRPWLYTKDAGRKMAQIYQPDCKLWGCSYCSTKKRKFWAKRIYHGMQEYDEKTPGRCWQFVTLTSHGQVRTLDGGIYVWRNAWPMLRKRITRASGKFVYALLPEQHQDGSLHTHMLTDAPLFQNWYKKNAPQCGLGYIVDSEPIYSKARAAFYVSKYLAKGLTVHDWPRNFRRIRTSVRWPQLPSVNQRNKNVTWSKVPRTMSIGRLVKILNAEGFTVGLFDSSDLAMYAHA